VKSPKATVVIATYRPEGAVIPLRSLAEQSLQDFNVVLVTEIGDAAWGNVPLHLPWPLKVIDHSPLKYHSPTHALNAGIDAATGEYIALLTDFGYAGPDWLRTLVFMLQSTKASFVGGCKCSHGPADNFTCVPAGANQVCSNHPLIPQGIVPEVAVVYPSQAAFTLGNGAFRRADGIAVNGLEERFAGAHGFEDENFVRRLLAHTRQQAVLARPAMVHHYWPYSSGYKPLVDPTGRTWAHHFPLNWQLDRLLLESEVLMGNCRAQRVAPVDVADERLVERIPSPPPPAE